MCAKMPIVIESVGDQGQRVEQGFEWPDDSALKRVEKEGALAGSGGAGGQRPRSLQKMEGQSRPSEW
jgi:hypothetical protein